MGNVHMEASQVNYRGGETKMSVEEAIKNGAYELPIAGAETLGGVKVGSGLSINAETGVLSASGYELPIAGAETLGGVKVGSGLSINAETGVLSASSQTWDYSTSEVNTGQKWIGGKEIYCKVYQHALTNNTAFTLEEDFALTKSLVKIDQLITAEVDGKKYASAMGTMVSANDIVICQISEDDLIVVVRDNYSAYTGYFTVYYTKTTV